ncbi:MAG: hypothetical protein UU77_C0008G0036 [candidate division WWE3 bacterium GW2011_GWC1_41_7]|uniref:Xylose isomerase-like TIM barrel domain-containing protein n=2 Tax=Katanobacteria TaxID=422282 RepID=A0A0G0X7V7_UNCKA|nr:MAG: hypothetical protein UU77_C0008G0036 [candidate division WWE3 bacterium GW2011_GWC1_41_7]KKS21579.1 MAG: hypothetical protein UU80_C0026G0011 [candidate division WWE3 bacterium GW2011_GWA1_41_8]
MPGRNGISATVFFPLTNLEHIVFLAERAGFEGIQIIPDRVVNPRKLSMYSDKIISWEGQAWHPSTGNDRWIGVLKRKLGLADNDEPDITSQIIFGDRGDVSTRLREMRRVLDPSTEIRHTPSPQKLFEILPEGMDANLRLEEIVFPGSEQRLVIDTHHFFRRSKDRSKKRIGKNLNSLLTLMEEAGHQIELIHVHPTVKDQVQLMTSGRWSLTPILYELGLLDVPWILEMFPPFFITVFDEVWLIRYLNKIRSKIVTDFS